MPRLPDGAEAGAAGEAGDGEEGAGLGAKGEVAGSPVMSVTVRETGFFFKHRAGVGKALASGGVAGKEPRALRKPEEPRELKPFLLKCRMFAVYLRHWWEEGFRFGRGALIWD